MRRRQRVHINVEDQVRTQNELLPKSGSLKALPKGLVQVDLIFKIRLFQGRKKPLNLLLGEMIYLVDFELEKKLSALATERLFNVVAPLTAWPYLRHKLHHILPDMGLPQILLPIRQALSRNQTRPAED